MSRHYWYPLDTELLSYRWFDPEAENPMEHGPALEIRMWLDKDVMHPERLPYEVRRAFQQLMRELVARYGPEEPG